jgi:hypothetical protein
MEIIPQDAVSLEAGRAGVKHTIMLLAFVSLSNLSSHKLTERPFLRFCIREHFRIKVRVLEKIVLQR